MNSRRVPAVYMRGGTSKGVLFDPGVLPSEPARRDALLLRALGSPARYGKQIDGLGAGSSSTSKVALVSRSARPDSDADHLLVAVAVDAPLIASRWCINRAVLSRRAHRLMEGWEVVPSGSHAWPG